MKHWLLTERYENWLVDKKLNFSLRGFATRNKKTVLEMTPGDLIVIHIASRKASLGGIVKVTSKLFEDVRNELIWDDFFPLRVKTIPLVILEEQSIVPIVSLLDKLSFVRSKKKWGCYFQHTLRRLSIGDFKILNSAIQKASWKKSLSAQSVN